MQLSDSYSFFCPTKIFSGAAALDGLPVELDGFGVEKPMVLGTSNAATRGTVRRVAAALSGLDRPIGVIDALPADPGPEAVTELAAFFLEKGCDAFIAVGGGLAVDLVKLANIAARHPGIDPAGWNDAGIPGGPLFPFVLVPAIDGNGMDAGRWARLWRLCADSPMLMPDMVVIDERTAHGASVPEIAAYGMTALGLAVGAICDPGRNPLSDAYALTAAQSLFAHLERALRRPRDAEARLAVVNAATMAACAVADGLELTVFHLGAALARNAGAPIGAGMAAVLAAVLAEGRPETVAGLATLATALSDPGEVPDPAPADTVLDLIRGVDDACRELAGTGFRRGFAGVNADAVTDTAVFQGLDPVRCRTLLQHPAVQKRI